MHPTVLNLSWTLKARIIKIWDETRYYKTREECVASQMKSIRHGAADKLSSWPFNKHVIR